MIKVFEINTEFKEVTTKEPVIVLKIDKATASNLCLSLGMVYSKAKNREDNETYETDLDMIHKFLSILQSEVNSTKR